MAKIYLIVLTRYLPKQKVVKTKNLILGNDETEEELNEVKSVRITLYW